MTKDVQKPARVLVVDASPAGLAELDKALVRAGLEPLTCAGSAEALKLLGEEKVDLVLSERVLPGMDGLELVRHLKAAHPDEFLPVLLVSARADRATRLEALRAGADDFLARPLDEEELIARVQGLLRIKRQQDLLRARSAELERLSVTDGLTGLYNRRFFQERLREEFRRAQRYDDPLALIMIDLDHFKDINDRRGHMFGDEVLRQTAQLLTKGIRDTDAVCRYGGEEFTVVLPRTHLSGCLTVAERIWRDLNNHRFRADGGTERMSASLGVSSFPNKDVGTPEDLLRTADEALYTAKRSGRNKICLHQHVSYFFSPDDAQN